MADKKVDTWKDRSVEKPAFIFYNVALINNGWILTYGNNPQEPMIEAYKTIHEVLARIDMLGR